MTDLEPVRKAATRMLSLGFGRGAARKRMRGLVREADRARDRKDWRTASRLYREALDIDPAQPAVRVQLGHAYKELGDLANAGVCYREALRLAPHDDDLYLQIGHLEKVKGNLRDAALAYRRSTELNPRNPDAAAEYAALAASLGLPPQPAPAGGTAAAGTATNGALYPSPADATLDAVGKLELRLRGDRARDARRWREAASAYAAYLAQVPDDFAIRVQLGHALKESGDHTGSENAYRTALALDPTDADLHLQLGHVLKLRGKPGEAIDAYRRSFELRPMRTVWNELKALDPAEDPLALRAPAAAERSPAIFLDISDLLIALDTWDFISGIQRVQLGLLSSVLDDTDSDCRFAVWRNKELWVLAEPLLASLVPGRTATTLKFQQARKIIAEIEKSSLLYAPVAGDVIVSTGSTYYASDLVAQREQLKRVGVRFGAYCHDFIPLTHPEFCDSNLVEDFSRATAEALLHLDFVLTVSEHVASEARRLLHQAGYPPIPVRSVLNAHTFPVGPAPTSDTADRWTPAIAALRGREYVLCVGTLSVHKNQSFLLQVWQLLVQEGYQPPLLVLAGAQNFGGDEIRIRLAWSRNVDERVKVIDRPSDDELAVLYRNCLFTMFPSLVEGWGLPVGESLAYGKLCITSHLASLPEVGADFVLYIDPYNVRGCADLLKDLFDNRAKLAAFEARVRNGFTPRGWREHYDEFVAAVKEQVAAGEMPSRAALGALAPAETLRLNGMLRTWKTGKALAPYTILAEAVKPRVALLRGWCQSEFWGTWMAGRYARLSFRTTAAPGSIVTVVLQLRAAPWSRNNTLHVTSDCGSTASMPVPESGMTEARWRGRRYKEALLGIDCAVGSDGSVSLLLEVTGALLPGWRDESRTLCVGLVRLVYLPALGAAAPAMPNRRIRPIGLIGPAGEMAYPIGLQSMLAAVQANAMLLSGWDAPEGWGAWLSAAEAQLALPTEMAPGEPVRVVLQLRTAAAPTGVTLSIASGGGAAALWPLPGNSPLEVAWLDCRVDADRSIRLTIRDTGRDTARRVASSHRRVGLVSLAYGRRDSIEDRLALTEALLYPVPDDLGPVCRALLADLRYTVAGHLKGSYSLAAINRSLAIGLEAAYPGTVRVEQIETDPVHDLTGVPAGERPILESLAGRMPDPAGAEVAIVQHWPVLKPPSHSDLPLALFVWEESLVPRKIVEHFNRHYRAILTQTSAVSKALLDSGIAIPVHMAGCAIDLSPFAAVAERRAAAGPRQPIGPERPFTFLHVSSCFPRKGADLLLKAFAEAFHRDDPVRLVIKAFPNPHNDVAEQIAELRASNPDVPAIELIDQDFDEEPLLGLYETADAMVLPTRGEGFNMPAAEAMAAGLPLIVTGHGGQMDFAGARVARLLDYQFAPSQSHVCASGSVWAEPDVADLVAALRETVTAAGDARGSEGALAAQVQLARQAVAPFGDRAAWGRRVADAACRFLTADPARFVTVGWVSTWKVRCGIAEYSRHLLSHFPQAARDVTVFCDARTDANSLVSPGEARAQVAWRVVDEPSMDDLAEAIGKAGVDAVVVQHHEGYLGWRAVARLLADDRVSSHPVLIFVHHVRDLFNIEAADRVDIVDALKHATRVLVHSVSDLNILKSFGLIDNVTLFPHGAEQANIVPRPVQSFSSGGSPLVGAYGFFLPPKGFHRLIDALPTLRARWSTLRLRFVTAEYPEPISAAEIARCRALARSLGVAEAIEWITDYLPNRRSLELLNECDLVVLPYQQTTESASGAVRVALASRAPVLVTPMRIFEELDEAVLRFEENEVDDLAPGIARVLEDPERRRVAVEQAGEWLRDHDWKLMAERLQGMVAGLVATASTSQ